MKRVHEAIVVEGKYDVIRVKSAVDAIVVPTDGFRLFKDPEKRAMLRRLAAARGLILLTDSDSAGAVIRNHLIGCIPGDRLKQAYVPPRPGKEKRKSAPSKEGLLGVEGIDNATVLAALERAGATFEDAGAPTGNQMNLTKADLAAAGLSGGTGSAIRRQHLLHLLELPATLSANRLLEVVNATVTPAQWDTLLTQLDDTASPEAE